MPMFLRNSFYPHDSFEPRRHRLWPTIVLSVLLVIIGVGMWLVWRAIQS